MKPRVVVVDDNPALRNAIKLILQRQGCEVIGEAADCPGGVSVVAALHPDLVVIDRCMPGGDGFQVAGELSALGNGASIIMVSTDLAPYHVTRGIQLGIRGFVRKKDIVEELPKALREISSGRTFLGRSAQAQG
jgi:two-component system response regulator EvgA